MNKNHSCFCKSCVPSPACENKTNVQKLNQLEGNYNRLVEQNKDLQKTIKRICTFQLIMNGRQFGKNTFLEMLDNWQKVKAENQRYKKALETIVKTNVYNGFNQLCAKNDFLEPIKKNSRKSN